MPHSSSSPRPIAPRRMSPGIAALISAGLVAGAGAASLLVGFLMDRFFMLMSSTELGEMADIAFMNAVLRLGEHAALKMTTATFLLAMIVVSLSVWREARR